MMNCVLAHSLTTFRTSAQGPGHDLGYEVKDEQGRKFVYVQFHNAAANKDVVGWMRSATKNRVTKFIGSSSQAGVAGVMLGSGAAALGYGWIQTEGVGYGDMKVTGTLAAGKLIYWSEDSKGADATTSATKANAFAYTLAAKSATVIQAGKYILGGRKF